MPGKHPRIGQQRPVVIADQLGEMIAVHGGRGVGENERFHGLRLLLIRTHLFVTSKSGYLHGEIA
jgi:hypothetical protein